MSLKTVRDIDLKNKRVIMRADFNVPLKEGNITDDTRIQAALPTIEYILKQEGSRLILMSHLGRPKGEPDPAFSLAPVAKRLEELLKQDVSIATDCVGSDVEKMVADMQAGSILLLENVRFHNAETKNDAAFAEKLAKLADVYVNDAFGTAHRAHASTEGITKYLPSVAGFLMEKEDLFFAPLLDNPEKPFVAIIGGAKVSSKIGVLESLLPKVSSLIIGGGMAYTFLTAKGHSIGKSLFEEEFLDTAKSLLREAEKAGVEIFLPVDHLVADDFSETAKAELVSGLDIPDGKIGMDIGPKTLEQIQKRLNEAKNIVWNGPMGVFEFDNFAKGTLEVAKSLASCQGRTVVGGGDSVAAINKFGLAESIDHVSTGGGASLEYLEGKALPGVLALKK